MTQGWQRGFDLWAIFVGVFGAVLALGAFAATDGIARVLFALFGSPLPEVMDSTLRFCLGLMGAVTMGWGLTYAVLFRALFALPVATAAPLWRATLTAALVWYVVDSMISVATGIAMNAVSNTLLIAALVALLVGSGVLTARQATARLA